MKGGGGGGGNRILTVHKKLRCSAHRLKIEIGRYSRIYNDDAKRYEQLSREKRICDTCKDKVEDELHFLLECPLNEEIRPNFLQKIDKITTEDLQSWSDTDEIKYLFETTDKSIINCFGKFVFDFLKSIGNTWGRVLEFDMECRALHGFGASASLGGPHGQELLGGFGVGLPSSLRGVANLMLFLALPGDEVGWTLRFVGGFGLW